MIGWILFGFGRILAWYHEGDPVGFVMALIGAVLLLFGYRRLLKPSTA